MTNGKLYVIGTPIGNLKDITIRAIETLEKIDILVCEDSRVTSRLINHYLENGMLTKKPRYVPYNEFNEDRIFQQVIDLIQEGAQVGLVSDAGMPTISDPGYRVIRAALDAKLDLEVVPGPTALTTALAWSGIGGEMVLYVGFLPKTSGKATRILEEAHTFMMALPSARLVMYVSPHRLLKDLALVQQVIGNAHCVLTRELTKQFAERIEGTASELLETYTKKKVKGELVLVIGVSDRT